MMNHHAAVIDDPSDLKQRFDERGVLSDVSDGRVEPAGLVEGVAPDEEVHQSQIGGAADVEPPATVLVAGDPAADQRRRQQRL